MKHWMKIGQNSFGKAKVRHGITYHDHITYHKIVWTYISIVRTC